MSAGWVGGSVRGRLLARHRLGPDGARALAATSSLDAACAELGGSVYADAVADAVTVDAVQHALLASALWDLRVLAGWVPARGVETLRVFAAWFEIRNLEHLLLDERVDPPAFEMGTLATAWTRVREARSPLDVRDALRRSAWRDPGSDDATAMLVSMRLEWAQWISGIGGSGRYWGSSAAALVVARSIAEHPEPLDAAVTRRAAFLGRRVADVSSFPALVAALPETCRWVFEGIEDPRDLWRAEARWWGRLERDGTGLLRAPRPGPAVVLGAVAVILADAWRTTAALEIASRGGRGQEVIDATA